MTYAGLDVVVPVYNEEAAVTELVARLRAAVPGARLILVDNASSDGTVALVAAMPEVHLVRHRENLGYGRSLADGIAAGSGERIVMIDADLEYLPEDIPALDRALAAAPAVWGSRFLRPGARGSAVWSLGNGLVTRAFNLLFGQGLTDLYTGIRGVRRAALPADGLRSPGFEFVLELAAALARAGVRIVEVPVGYAERRGGRSKMRHVRELLKFAVCLVALRLRPPRPPVLSSGRAPAPPRRQ
jgi:glycosyltransferase involved in cell wall biosynthesis